MPKYKFQWSNLPSTLLDALRRDPIVDGDDYDSAEALRAAYGARPKDDFIRDAWPTLLQSWLQHEKDSREWIVGMLRETRREDGRLTNRKAQMEYLRGLRNAKKLRSIVLREFIAFGEVEPTLGKAPPKPVETAPPKPEVAKPHPVKMPTPPTSGDDVTTTTEKPPATPAESKTFTAAPGSIVIVRDEEWLVTAVEAATDGYFVNVIGLSELVRDTDAVFSSAIDDIVEADPTKVSVVADDSPKFRRSRLWLESMLRKTPVAIADPGLTIAQRGLADRLEYQLMAVRKALDPDKLRPRILLADAVGLGKTLEIGMILSELVTSGPR